MKLAKRTLDVAISAGALVLLSPVFLVAAILIKLDSPGPVFFVDRRAGKEGEPFGMIKFRTMVVNAASMGLGRVVAENDSRITRTGRFLRTWTLDEIPQLLNVLRGEMSLVGPRPATPEQMARCSPQQRRRLEVRPGMAGWAWIHGRNSISWSERIELDVWYVDHWSLGLDVRIVVRAFLLLLRRQGVYGRDGVTQDIDWVPVDDRKGNPS